MELTDYMQYEEFRAIEANGLPINSVRFEVGETYVMRYGYSGSNLWIEVLQECASYDPELDIYGMDLLMVLDASPQVYEAMIQAGVEIPD